LGEKQIFMIENPKRYTITAALPYTNGPIHIGHLAGVYVPSDIYARYLRLQGKDVAFICGSDEHGVAISMKAKKEGITPQQVIDKYDGIIRKSFIDFGISFDNYSRTSSKIHHDTASEFFRTLYDKGVSLDCEFLGKINYKVNIYDDEKNYLKSLYRKNFCWRSKLTQKLYFLDNKTLDDIKILKSEILLTNTKIEK